MQLNVVISTSATVQMRWRAICSALKRKNNPDFGAFAQTKNWNELLHSMWGHCCDITLLRINKSVCGYNYHSTEIFPPRVHLSKRHAVKITAKLPCRRSVRHLCGTWAEGELPLAEYWGTGWRSLLLTRWPCCKGQKWRVPKTTTQSFVSLVKACCVSALLTFAFQTLYILYVGTNK